MEFKPLNKRIRIKISSGKTIDGDLHEIADTKAVLPQHFAKLEDGTMRDLRNDCYWVIEE